MGASGSVIRLETIPAEEVGKFVANIGKDYKPYKALIVDNGISGEVLATLRHEEDVVNRLKAIGIKNRDHQKVLSNQLLKLSEAFSSGVNGPAGASPGSVHVSSGASSFNVTTDGIRINILHEFIMSCGGRDALRGMTSKDVCDRFVKPKTARGHLSYLDLLKSQNKPGISTSTVYLSHSWRSPFLDVVDALDCRYGRDSEVSIWFDMFCISQHTTGIVSADQRISVIRGVTEAIKKTLLVASPWDNPVQFSSAWCVLELCLAIENKSELEISMNAREENNYVDAILDDFEVFDRITTSVDLRNVQTAHPPDKSKVVEELKKSRVGIAKINRVLNQQLREWTIRTMRKVYDEEEDPGCKFDYKVTLGALYRNMGKFADAEVLLAECLEKLRADLGNEHSDTLSSMCNLASIYESQGKYEQAEALLSQGLSVAQRTLSGEDPITMTIASSLADVLSQQQKYALAEPLYKTCLQTSITNLGPKHPDTLTSKNNLAYLYVSSGRNEEAEQLLTACLDERTKQLGADHPDTLATIHNLAYLYKSQRKYAASEPLYFRALELQRLKLGEEHPNTLSSMCGLAGVYEAQGKLELAEPLYQEATEKGRLVLGSSHPSVQEWKSNFEKFQKRRTALRNVTKGSSENNERSTRRMAL